MSPTTKRRRSEAAKARKQAVREARTEEERAEVRELDRSRKEAAKAAMSLAELRDHIKRQSEYNRKYYRARKAIGASKEWEERELAVWEEFWAGRSAKELGIRAICNLEMSQLKRQFSPVQHQIRLHKRWLTRKRTLDVEFTEVSLFSLEDVL